MGIFNHFDTENYTRRLDIVQNICEFGKLLFYDFLDPKWPNTTIIYILLANLSKTHEYIGNADEKI